MATTAEKIIRIDVVTSANAQRTIKALATDMAKVEQSAASMQRGVAQGFGNLNSMLSKFGSFIGAFGLTTAFGAITRGILEMASSYKILGDRFEGILGSSEKARVAVEDISAIAITTGRELDGVGKLYEKASRAAVAYGLSTASVKDITLGFSQALRLSGASTQEAYAALVQFGQALASGRLQGDELRSILENNSVFMYELAAAAGKTVTELRKMGSEGKLGPKELFDIMTKRGEDGLNMLQRIDKKAAEIPLTFSQSATAVSSAMTRMIGEIAKALGIITDDKQGVFGFLIRALDMRAQQLANTNRIGDAAGDGWWEQLKRFGSVFMNTERGGRTGAGLTGVGEELPLARMVDNEIDTALKKYEAASAELAKRRREFMRASPELTESEVNTSPALREMQAEADKLYQSYVGLRRLQSELRYGEKNEEPVKPITPVDPETERRLKTARESLINWIEAREREAAANKMVLDGNVREMAQAKDLAELRDKLAEAGIKEASALGQRARAAVEAVSATAAELKMKEDAEKFNAKRAEDAAKREDQVRERIARDTAALEALRMKTRSSQEFITDELERERKEIATTLSYLSNFDIEETPEIRQLRLMLDLLDQAIEKRKELEMEQALIRQNKEQQRVDNANARRVQSAADSLNEDIKDAIKNSDTGEALWETLRRTFQDRTLDIVINPVTSIISRVLAQIADDFSRMLTQAINVSLANQTSDPLGTLISLANYLGPTVGGTSAESSLYSLPTSGVKLGGYPLAEGMSYVPYDGFPATLHRGERVLTAQENSEYSGGGVTVVNSPVINIDSGTDQARIVEYVARGMEESQRMMWAQFKARGMA